MAQEPKEIVQAPRLYEDHGLPEVEYALLIDKTWVPVHLVTAVGRTSLISEDEPPHATVHSLVTAVDVPGHNETADGPVRFLGFR